MGRTAPEARSTAFIRTMVVATKRFDPTKALQRTRLTPRSLRRTDDRTTAESMETFSEAALRHLDDEALGWFARRAAVGSYGMLCRASLNSPDLGVALRHGPRHTDCWSRRGSLLQPTTALLADVVAAHPTV
jgi:Arabinose-binding domain of AraC transcription regulator, N-term